YGVARLYLIRGHVDQAIDALKHASALLETDHIAHLAIEIGAHLGYARALCGDLSAALPLLEGAVERSVSCKFAAMQSRRVAYLSEAYLLADRLDDAGRGALEALALSRDQRARGHEGWALRLLGAISGCGSPLNLGQAESYYRQAL